MGAVGQLVLQPGARARIKCRHGVEGQLSSRELLPDGNKKRASRKRSNENIKLKSLGEYLAISICSYLQTDGECNNLLPFAVFRGRVLSGTAKSLITFFLNPSFFASELDKMSDTSLFKITA